MGQVEVSIDPDYCQAIALVPKTSSHFSIKSQFNSKTQLVQHRLAGDSLMKQYCTILKA